MRAIIARHHSLLTRGLLLALAALALVTVRRAPEPASDAGDRIAFYRARIGGPATYPTYARLGAAYLKKARETGQPGCYAEAERLLAQSLRYQRNYEALFWLSAVYAAQHRFDEALPYAREALAAMPGDLDAQGALFDIYLGIGDRRNAELVLRRMLEQGPGFAGLARLSMWRQSHGDLPGARQAMERACAARLAAEPRAWCKAQLAELRTK